MTGAYVAIIGLAALVVFLSILCVAILRSHAEILRHLDRLGIRLDEGDSGSPLALSPRRSSALAAISDISGVDPDGNPVVVSPTTGSDPVIVAFLSTTCSSCTVFWEGLDQPTIHIAGSRHRVVVVTLGASEESPTRAAALARGSVDVVMSSEAWNEFEVPGAPYFALIDPTVGEVIGEGSASTMEALTTFLEDAAGDRRWDQRQTISDRTDADRERMIDEELRRAGILPGDPSLHPPTDEQEEG